MAIEPERLICQRFRKSKAKLGSYVLLALELLPQLQLSVRPVRAAHGRYECSIFEWELEPAVLVDGKGFVFRDWDKDWERLPVLGATAVHMNGTKLTAQQFREWFGDLPAFSDRDLEK